MPWEVYGFDSDVDAPLFIVGTTGVVSFFGSKDLFLKGYPRNRQNSSIDAYVSGIYGGNVSGYITLTIQGGYSDTHYRSAYIAGASLTSGIMPLVIEGDVTRMSSGINLYTSAPNSDYLYTTLAMSGNNGYGIGNCVLFISGPVDSTNGYVHLFARGI